MTRARLKVLTGRLVLGALLLSGCQDQDAAEPGAAPVKQPGLAWHECPTQVELSLTTKHRCGTLTVPVDHTRPEAATADLGLVEVWPPGGKGTTREDVALSVGFNFGEPRMPPSDMLALAERIAAPVVALTPRGVGADGGVPLACPELDGLDGLDTAPSGASADATRRTFTEAVASCRDRLISDGVDLDLFGVEDIAADLEELRAALGVEQWYTMVSYGEMSRVSDAYASSYGEHVRSIVEDSPAPSGRDSSAVAGEGLRSALDALFAQCADDRVCAARYPDLAALWREALARLAAQPLRGVSDGGEFLVDAPTFVLAVRSILGNARYVSDLPRIITTASEGQLHPTLTSVIAADSAYCLGYRPFCTNPDFSMGAYLSQVCPELGTGDAAEGDPLLNQVFGDSPYADACETWDVAVTEPPPAPGAPTLVLTGGLDPWSRPEWFVDAVEVRTATHDVAVSACVFEVRNPWIADPRTAPDPSPCDNEPFPDWD